MEGDSLAARARACLDACIKQPPMTLEETLTLAPWEKWARFGRFPFKMVTHLLLVALVTFQAVDITKDYSNYSRSVGRNWVNLFFPEDYQDFQTIYDSWSQYRIFTQEDVVNDAQRLVDVYYQLPTLSVDSVYVSSSETHAKHIPTPYVVVTSNGHEKKYDLYNSSTGWPLAKDSEIVSDEEQLIDFFDDLDKMRFYFVIKSDGGYEDGHTLCLLWDVHFTYNLHNRAQMFVSSTYKPRERCGADVDKESTVFVLCYFVLIAAFYYQLLLFKQMFAYFEVLHVLKTAATDDMPLPASTSSLTENLLPHHEMSDRTRDRDDGRSWWLRDSFGANEDVLNAPIPRDRQLSILDYEDLQAVWTTLTWKEKLGAFNFWLLASTTGNICAIVYCFEGMVGSLDVSIHYMQRVTVGLACLMYWVSMVQYFEFNPRYYIFINTLKTALPRVGQFLLGILPFFIGYAMVGMTLFGDKSERFGSFFQTLITLFSVVNGDIVRDTFDELAFMPVVSDIYLYVYILLFSYVCLMTIIAIVEESFFAANGDSAEGQDNNDGAPNAGDGNNNRMTGRQSSMAVHAMSRGLSTAVTAADIKGLNRKSVFTQGQPDVARSPQTDDLMGTSPHTRQLPPKLRQALRQAHVRADGRYASESERPSEPLSPLSPRMSRLDHADRDSRIDQTDRESRVETVRPPQAAFLPTDGGNYVSVEYVRRLLDAAQEEVLSQSPSDVGSRTVNTFSKVLAKLD